MPPDVNILVSRAKELARRNDQDSAMNLADDLIERYPNEAQVWSLRGYLHGRVGRHSEAISDLTRAIEIDDSDPYLFFSRGVDRFELGDDQLAIDDFSRALGLSERQQNPDYRETLLFWRAETLLRRGKKREALEDLAGVRDDFSFWTYKLRTKADLLADCENLSG
jgi:tetratricopeptide (TPR) repeat protein